MRNYTKIKFYIFLVLVGALLLMAVFATKLVPYDPYEQDLSISLQAPSHIHWLGTDRYGRDMLSRVMMGAQTTVFTSLFLVAVISALGTLIGVICAYKGGMNQRVGIVMAMMLKPDLLFADEPTSALDVIVQAQVVKEMMKLRNEFGTSIVIITHNMGLVSYMADKVAVMYQGHLMEYGHVKDVINHPQNDYTKRLIQAVPKIRKG